MKTKPTKSDEELVASYQHGDEIAFQMLFDRYWGKKSMFLRLASRAFFIMFNDTDKEHIFLSSFLAAANSYLPGKTSFRKFFILMLRQDLTHEARHVFFPFGERYPLSLDLCDINSGLSLHDSIPADNSEMDETDLLLNKVILLHSIECSSLPKTTEPLIEKILEGYTLKEAAELLHIPYRTAKSVYAKFKAWIKEFLEKTK